MEKSTEVMNIGKASFSPFGRSSKLGKGDQNGAEFSTDNSSNSIVGGSDSEMLTSPVSELASSRSDFRIKPKVASEPQIDMYERMQKEQEMRLEEFERRDISTGQSSLVNDIQTSGKETEKEENFVPSRSIERRRDVEEKFKIQEDQRIDEEERAYLGDENKIWEEKPKQKKQSELFEKNLGNKDGGNEDNMKELSEDDQKEKERMKEIQRLAREQARFEIEARGLPKEEKNEKEKIRMERLYQLAREQAQYEYDRRHADEKFNQPTASILPSKKGRNKYLPNRMGDSNISAKEKKVRQDGQGLTNMVQTADASASNKYIEKRVRSKYSDTSKDINSLRRRNEKLPKNRDQFEADGIPSDDRDIEDRFRSPRESLRGQGAQMGSTKEIKEGGEAFENFQNILKEGNGAVKTRLEQLEDLVKKQSQYKNDPTKSTGTRQTSKEIRKKDLFTKNSKGQIIDVEIANDNSGEILENMDNSRQNSQWNMERQDTAEKEEKSDADEKKNQPLPQNSKLGDRYVGIENGGQVNLKTEKRKQLEAQARRRSKQQSQRNEAFHTEQKEIGDNKHDTFNSSARATVSEKSIQNKSEKLTSKPQVADQSGVTKKEMEVANAIMKLDGSYQPSPKALFDTSRMLDEVRGFSLFDYKGRKEFLQKKSNVSVYVGRSLSIPVRVSTPGSFVEFSIFKKASEFDFGILAVPDKGYAVDIKVRRVLLLKEELRILFKLFLLLIVYKLFALLLQSNHKIFRN